MARLMPEWPASIDDSSNSCVRLPDGLQSALAAWLLGVESPAFDTTGMLLRTLLSFLASPEHSVGVSVEHLLKYLGDTGSALPADQQSLFRERLMSIQDTVVQDKSPAALFKQKVSPVFRGLLLYLLDPEYRENRELPRGCAADENDLLIAEVLRGAARGWSRVPTSLRGYKHAELAIGHTTARLVNTASGRLQLRQRTFEWESVESVMVAFLNEFVRILQAQAGVAGLNRLVTRQKASEIEIKIVCKGGRSSGSRVSVDRAIKGSKKKKLTMTMQIPLK